VGLFLHRLCTARFSLKWGGRSWSLNPRPRVRTSGNRRYIVNGIEWSLLPHNVSASPEIWLSHTRRATILMWVTLLPFDNCRDANSVDSSFRGTRSSAVLRVRIFTIAPGLAKMWTGERAIIEQRVRTCDYILCVSFAVLSALTNRPGATSGFLRSHTLPR
jgi:hypothetical protein